MPNFTKSRETSAARPSILVVKVFGKKRRVERTYKILRDLGASDSQTAIVCQDDLLREALSELGIKCLSFDEQIDQESELRAWNEGIRVKNEIFKHISQPPFQIQGYECPECLLGVDADRFAFLALTVFLNNKLFRKGFRKIILVLGQKYLWRLPNSSARYGVVIDGPLREHVETLLRKSYPFSLPFLALPSPSRLFQKCLLYEPAPRTRFVKTVAGRLRVLIVVTDSEEFRSYYSRPAAILAKACVEIGHEVLIATSRFASPIEFTERGFEAVTTKKLILGKIWSVGKEILRVRARMSACAHGVARVSSGDLWNLACTFAVENIGSAAFAAGARILLFDDLVARFRPHVVVAIPDSSYLGMAAVAVARKKGIPSLTVLAGQIFDHPQYGFLNADVVAVNGEPARKLFLRRGISPDRVVVTGMAHYDETFTLAERLQASRKSTGPRLVVFATENLPVPETLRMISAVAEAIMMKPSIRLAIRPHPREDEAIYKDYVGKFHSDKIYVDSTTPLLELFSKTEVVVTGFSNVAVEAMILERPVICMNLGGKPDKLGYIQEGAAIGVHRPDETAKALHKALFDERARSELAKGRKAFLQKHFYRADGNASARIVRLIEELAGKTKSAQ